MKLNNLKYTTQFHERKPKKDNRITQDFKYCKILDCFIFLARLSLALSNIVITLNIVPAISSSS